MRASIALAAFAAYAVLLLVGVLAIIVNLAGCATAHCSSMGLPAGEQAYANFGGSQVGNQALALAQTVAKVGGTAGTAQTGSTPTQGPGCTIDYNVPPIFGSDYVSTGITAPSAPSTTINNQQGGIINMGPVPH